MKALQQRVTRILEGSEHPFWAVLLLAEIAVLAPFSASVAALLQTQAPSYLWLSVLLIGGFASLLVAVFYLARRKRFGRAVWWIAHTFIAMAVLVPLLIADYLLIMPLLLASVPLKICVANRLRHIPAAFAYTLFGASAMMAVDLFAPFPRPALFEDLGQNPMIPLTFQMLYLAVLLFLVWFYRVRPNSPRFTRLNLASQQTLVAIGVTAASLLGVTALLAFLIRGSQITQIGLSQQLLANSFAERTAGDLEQAVYSLVRLGHDPVIQKGLKRANDRYPESAEAVQALLAEGEQQWEAAKVGKAMLPYRDNAQNLALADFRHSEHSHRDLFLTDREGGLVAAQGNKPPRFAYASEAWWQAVWQDGIGGIYFSPVQIDPRTQLPFTFVAVGVLDTRSNKLLGVLASTYDLLETQNLYAGFKGIGGERVQLIDNTGRVIASSAGDLQEGAPTTWPGFAGHPQFHRDGGTFANNDPGWMPAKDQSGRAVVMGHAPLRTFSGIFRDSLAALDCRVVVSKSRSDALIGVTRSTKIAAVVGLMAMAFSVFAALFTTRWVSRPIDELTHTAKAMVGGDLEQNARLVGTEELVSLAQSFNTLVSQLREKIADLKHYNRTLEDRVSERTEKLRRAQKSLVDGAHYSGMAEVARGVLHNIGNVLNSLNVSVNASLQLLDDSQVTKLENLNSLMQKTDAEMEAFLADPRKREALAEYVTELVQSLREENLLFTKEVNTIRDQAEVIRQSLLAQSKFTDRDVGYAEVLDLNEIIADLVYAEKEMLDQRHIQIHTEFEDVPPVDGLRTKLSYAVLTLIENAVSALEDNPVDGRHIHVQTRHVDGEVQVSIRDNGQGIAPSLLTKIFQYGYSTKPEGNGFGLHTCANTLKELGGEVRAESEGPGSGATFVLALPDGRHETSRETEPAAERHKAPTAQDLYPV